MKDQNLKVYTLKLNKNTLKYDFKAMFDEIDKESDGEVYCK